MRIIPINNSTTLLVLQEIPMAEYMIADGHKYMDVICNVSGTDEIVLYRHGSYNNQFWHIETIGLEIERSDLKPGNDWRSVNRQKSHNKYFREVKTIMISYIRENKIDSLFKEEDNNEYMWC